ncbi:DsbA family protein [Ligilactobacillus equi]|uniref:thioredoxin domain-containing protein n=1 Tax=Ligilactobacillus equi TaxID=137357 RepID=UPI002ED69ACA
MSDNFKLVLGKTGLDKATVVLNLGCSDSRQWFESNFEAHKKAAKEGQELLELYFWNKDKEPLRNGNIANDYIDYDDPKKALAYIKAIYEVQDTLNEQEDVEDYLKENFADLIATTVNKAQIKTLQYVIEHKIESLPTLLINDVIK